MPKLIAVFIIMTASSAFAHCPLHFRPENVCLMYDQNTLYIYPHGKSHDGPYVDLKSYTVDSIVTGKQILRTTKAARGIYKIEGVAEKAIKVNFLKAKEKISLDIKSE